LRGAVLRRKIRGQACVVDGLGQVVVDVRVHACEGELDACDLRLVADGKERLPAAGRGRAAERGLDGPEVVAGEGDVEQGDPCRVRKSRGARRIGEVDPASTAWLPGDRAS